MQTASSTLSHPEAISPENREISFSIGYLPIALALCAPAICFFFYFNYFSQLFWFGDEIHLLSEIRHEGFWNWIRSNFAENFVPLFKVLWGGSAILFGGSYLAMMAILWGTHILNGVLLASLLLRVGILPLGVAFAVVTFAVTASTHESLGWTVQWSAVLATTFFLSALHFLVAAVNRTAVSFSLGLFCVSCLFASSMCFSRGILVCATVSFSAFVWSGYLYFKKERKASASFLILSIFSMAPAVISASMIFMGSTGNHQSIFSLEGETLQKMVFFALHAFAMNPLSRLFGDDTVSWPELIFFMSIKSFILIWAFYALRKYSALTALIALTLLCFDLGNSTLLGLGRYHTDLRFAIGSRYQYEFLVSLSPFLAIAFSSFYLWISEQYTQRLAFALSALLVGAWSFALAKQWEPTLIQWSGWHGREGRRALLEMNAPPAGMTGNQLWLGIPPVISYDEAKAVTKEFNLH
jgi:hypothetical protein